MVVEPTAIQYRLPGLPAAITAPQIGPNWPPFDGVTP